MSFWDTFSGFGDGFDRLVGDLSGGNQAKYQKQSDKRIGEAAQAYKDVQDADFYDETVSPDMVLGPSAVAGVRGDKRDANAQRLALRQLQEISRGGLTQADMMALEQGRQEAARMEAGQRQATMRGMAERGMSGSGTEAAMQMMAQQQGANRLSNENMLMQQEAQRRAYQGMRDSGAMATQMRGQGFQEAAMRANALDEFNKNNTQYRRDVQQRNVSGQNQNAQYNANQSLNRAQGAAQVAGIQSGVSQNAINNANKHRDEFMDRVSNMGRSGVYGGDTSGGFGAMGNFGGK